MCTVFGVMYSHGTLLAPDKSGGGRPRQEWPLPSQVTGLTRGRPKRKLMLAEEKATRGSCVCI